MLYIHDYSPAETRWVPFASTHLSSSDEVLTFDEVRDRDEVEGVEVDERELMFVDLVEKDYESLEWTRDKVILLVGQYSALKPSFYDLLGEGLTEITRFGLTRFQS